MAKPSNTEKAAANLAVIKDRISRGLMTRACLYPSVVDKSPPAFYAAITRGDVKAVDFGRSKLLPPDEGARLIGMKFDPAA